MAKEAGTIGGFIIPAFLGIVIAVVVGMYIPQLTTNATESGMDFSGNAKVALEDTIRRFRVLAQGNFHDTAAWGVPLFGLVIGCFFRFITREDS